MDAKLSNVLEICLNVLNKAGLFFEGDPSASQRYWIKGVGASALTMAITVIGFLIKAISSNNLTGITSNLVIVCMVVFTSIKSWNIAFHCDKLIELKSQIQKQIDAVKKEQQFDNLKSVKERLSFTMKFVKLFTRLTAITLACNTVTTFVIGKHPFDAFESFHLERRSVGIYMISVVLNIIIDGYYAFCYFVCNSLPIVYIS